MTVLSVKSLGHVPLFAMVLRVTLFPVLWTKKLDVQRG